MKLLVGLGNPGTKYENNRHNIGFMTVDEIHHHFNFTSWKKRFQSAAAEGKIADEKCLILKPMTYMNESGQAVSQATRFYKIPPEDVIVFHDELDIKPGKIKVKTGGGNAGHNGLKSISSHIGNEYVRVRMGIGHPGQKDIVHIYVLNDFPKADRTWLDQLVTAVAKSTQELIKDNPAGFTNNISQYVKPNTSNKESSNKKPTENTSKDANSKVQTKTSSNITNALSDQLDKWLKKNTE